MKIFFTCLFLFITPTLLHAAVIISEVAWMGTTNSANDEWIELYNNGDQEVDLTGWFLDDGKNLNIELSGSISVDQYAVLERTDDSSAPGTAFVIYNGSLSNAGATLSLYRLNGSLEDRVVGGENWQNIGGDNVTKETAQYTDQGWITAGATPGTSNQEVIQISAGVDENIQEEETGKNNFSSASTPTLHMVPRELHIALFVPNKVYVNQEVSMSVEPSGLAKGILTSLDHQWNFGDLTTTTGKKVTKRFTFPGEYVVTVHSQYKDYEAYARKTILVLPVAFSITKSPEGHVQVHNNARYEVDISGYTIAGGTTLRFPEGSILLPNATVTIPKERIQFTLNATLFDETATQVASLIPVTDVVQDMQSVTTEKVSALLVTEEYVQIEQIAEKTSSEDAFSFLSEVKGGEKTQVQDPGTTTLTQEDAQTSAVIDATAQESSNKLPYFALLVVIGLGVITVVINSILQNDT